MTKKENYQYLLQLYSLVDEYLAGIIKKQENFPEVVVSFCIITEKIFKIKLHKINPVLIFENSRIKDDDSLVTVINKKESDIETIKIEKLLNRYKLMFDGEFSDAEIQVIIDIYNIRNHFIHGYKSDENILADKENIVKKMGTVWEKISVQAMTIFGKNLVKAKKPKEKYSKEELEKVLVEQVRKKIESYKNDINNIYPRTIMSPNYPSINTFANVGEKCPRCGEYGFSKGSFNQDLFSISNVNPYQPNVTSDLYKCSRCDLELTEKEYEIAKEIKNEK
jgi:hypothetical protein